MFPQFHWGDNEWAIYEPLASHRSPIEFSDDLLRAGQAGGVVLHDDFEVQRICYFRDHYRLISKDSVIKAKTLILAGGARMLPHLKDLGIAHSLDSKMITTYVALKDHEYFQLPSFFDRETLEFARLGVGKHVVLSNPHSRRLKEPFWHNDFTLVQAHDSYAPHRLGLCGFLLGQSRLMLATGWGGTAFKFSLEIGNRIGQTLETELTERNLLHA